MARTKQTASVMSARIRAARERTRLRPHQSLPPLHLAGANTATIHRYLGTVPGQTPFLRGVVLNLNMLLHFAMFGNLGVARELVGKVVDLVVEEGVDMRRVMGGDARWTRLRTFLGRSEGRSYAETLPVHQSKVSTLRPRGRA